MMEKKMEKKESDEEHQKRLKKLLTDVDSVLQDSPVIDRVSVITTILSYYIEDGNNSKERYQSFLNLLENCRMDRRLEKCE